MVAYGPIRALSERRQPRPTEVTLMNLSLRSILLLVAVVIFVLAAFGVSLGTVSLVPLGLAFLAAAFLVGEGGFGLRT
jgi:hypothetical protein